MSKKLISIVTPTFNEKDNIRDLIEEVINVIDVEKYEWRILVIDNASTDGTVEILREIAQENDNVQVILNRTNFGHIRSPYHGIISAEGDAVLYLASDFQDPPSLIPTMLEKWSAGAELVLAVKTETENGTFDSWARSFYYSTLQKLSEREITLNATGFGLYDKKIIHELKKINDPYPFLRGLIADLGFEAEVIYFKQPKRRAGQSKNSLYTLFDIAAFGLVKQSKLPLRFATFTGFLIGILSVMLSLIAVLVKLLFWENIVMGIAPIAVISFFLFGLVFIFLGIIGEYLIVINERLKNHPIVVEKERINFK